LSITGEQAMKIKNIEVVRLQNEFSDYSVICITEDGKSANVFQSYQQERCWKRAFEIQQANPGSFVKEKVGNENHT
jgi:hypothetical protein